MNLIEMNLSDVNFDGRKLSPFKKQNQRKTNLALTIGPNLSETCI